MLLKTPQIDANSLKLLGIGYCEQGEKLALFKVAAMEMFQSFLGGSLAQAWSVVDFLRQLRL